MKYIDAEKLIAELTKMQFELNAAYRKPQSDNIVRAISLEYDDILSLVDSLQQEQPEVDLEKEIQIWCHNPLYELTKEQDTGKAPVKVLISDIEDTARHFYELGLNARKEE